MDSTTIKNKVRALREHNPKLTEDEAKRQVLSQYLNHQLQTLRASGTDAKIQRIISCIEVLAIHTGLMLEGE